MRAGAGAVGEAAPGPTRRSGIDDRPTDEARWADTRAGIQRLIEGDGLSIVFQPIVDLDSGRVAGFEALARFTDESGKDLAAWFEEAAAVGLQGALETACVRAALAGLPALPPEAYLSVNASPAVAVSEDFRSLLACVPHERVVVEITEQAPVEDYEALGEALADLRAEGIRLAIDDAGAGFASMAHIVRLKPDLIKLDRSLISGIHNDPTRLALAESLASFAAAVGSAIVAEGIEDGAEISALREIGVRLGQGYYLGRPGPLPPPGLATSLPPWGRPGGRRRRGAAKAGSRRPHRLRLYLAAAVFAGSVVPGWGAIAYAENAQPGQALWNVKLWVEDVRLALETEPVSRVALHLEFATRRVAELSAAFDRGGRPAPAARALADLERHVRAARSALRTSSGLGAGREALRLRLEAALRHHGEVLGQLVESACGDGPRPAPKASACRGLRLALAHSAYALERVAAAHAKQPSGVPAPPASAASNAGTAGSVGKPDRPSGSPSTPATLPTPAEVQVPELPPPALEGPAPTKGGDPGAGKTQADPPDRP